MAAWLVLSAVACTPQKRAGDPLGLVAHAFPIESGDHAVSPNGALACDACHGASAESFASFSCVGCHTHEQNVVMKLHVSVMDFRFGAQTCVACHPVGARVGFTHTGIVNDCAQCHEEGAAYAALPRAGFTHLDRGSADCSACHHQDGWAHASAAPIALVADPARDDALAGLVPTFAGTSVLALVSLAQSLPMSMDHASQQIPTGAMSGCGNCHAEIARGSYYPGVFHASLEAQGIAQPSACADCHRDATPLGFVGPLIATRDPPSGEMRHDAVAWSGSQQASTAIALEDCGVCHAPPSDRSEGGWTAGVSGATGARYHASLAAVGASQPSSCLDCHANARPRAVFATGAVQLDHRSVAVAGDCGGCHAVSAWAGARFHAPGSATPAACAACHERERPQSTSGWVSTSYRAQPFDYGANALGIGHGGGQDCVTCHSGPGTGAWGAGQDWQAARFTHGPQSASAKTCVSCHESQRPDTLPGTTAALIGFDHAKNGTGDCFGCHQATVTRGSFASLFNPTTGALPGGDWRGGQTYPGSSLIASTTSKITLSEQVLERAASGLVTAMSQTSETLYNAMLHTATVIPPEMSPGTVSVDNSKCQDCHATGAVYADGRFHAALTAYAAPPGPFAQPTSGCAQCHAQMLPNAIVEKGASPLQAMAHAAFAGEDCSTCHGSPGASWADGVFHARVPAPADCATCHYPLMADASADVTSATSFAMKHGSTQMKTQACATCHTGALANAATVAATAWSGGQFHPSTPTQPTQCTDCHAVTVPSAATASSTSYALAQGKTANNETQWMSHAATYVAGKECAMCHLADAKASGARWSTSLGFHAAVPKGVTSCAPCHGLSNGNGSVAGSGNNLPAGLVDAAFVTTASSSPGTGIAAGTFDQIAHTDVNVSAQDCALCHTQVGASSVNGVAGKEWKQASFHAAFTGGATLTMNGTSGRCSNCHMNVKPGPSYAGQDHAGFSAASGSTDCSSCHSYPGTGTLAAPNWLGASGGHAKSGSTAASSLDCGSCHGQNGSAATHLGVAAASHYGGTANGNRCTSCHVDFSAFSGTTANLSYAHTNATADANGCGTCHAFSAQLYTTLTTTPALTHPAAAGGHQFSQAFSVTGSYSGTSFSSAHTDAKMNLCGSCHQYATTTATTDVWTFKHRPSNPGIASSQSSNGCNMCH
jgi:hypothetical protein